MKLDDKVVVITGSGGGIGEACARRFAAEGAKVVVTDIDPEGVERVSDSIGTVGLAVDITAEDRTGRRRPRPNHLRRNRLLVQQRRLRRAARQPDDIQDDSLWELGWQLHVMAHVHAAREVLPSMLERGDGYLLQTASVVALATQPDKAAYTVTKHAALALAEWLATTYGPKELRCPASAPERC